MEYGQRAKEFAAHGRNLEHSKPVSQEWNVKAWDEGTDDDD